LSNVIQNYGGSPQANYQDRYVRFGLIIFNSTATLNAPLYRDTPELIKILTDAKADGGTRYDLAFTLAKNHIVDALSKDLVPNRKTAIMFLTDGEPNEGCTAGPQKVKEIYELTDEDAKMRQIKTYVIGFGSGLGTAGENCLKKIAQEGHTNSQKCNTGRCLEFYAADSAADLADAFQDIINQATKEECNGMDNDCDGIIDNSPECSCVNSFTQPTSTSAISSTARRINPRVKLYTFISAFDIQGTCSPLNQDIDLIKTYQEACRNDTSKAISCSPAKLPNPPGNAYGLYCRRCCATTGMHCKWPQSHACSQPPWEKGKNDNTCMNNCKTWCKDNKQKAIDCLIPRGMLQRSDTGYNENGQLTVLRTLEFGRDVLNKQSQRWLFINLPSIDYRSKSLALRPVIAEVAPDNYDLPSIGGISWHSPDSSTWNVNHRFTTNNNNLTADLLGLAENCDSNAECEEDRQELIWTILGYNPSNGSSYRTHRLGAIYHSTPATSSAPSIVYPDVGYRNWIQTKIPAGKYTDKSIVERPTVIYVASNDGILHAFHADSGIELWGVIPATILHRLRSVPDGKDIDGSRLFAFDGSPLVQDVQLYRHIEQNEVKAQWMTVLIVGYRAGGRGYLALDVTNPYRPRLLWEINSDSLKEPSNPNRGKFDRFGYSYGQAFIANLLLDCRNLPASISTCQGGMQERAVAIIPGGVQLKKQLGHNILDQNDTNIGSVVYAVDLETGILLHQFAISDARGFASTPVGYAIAPAITTRVFVGDILGRLYRLDLQSSDPAQWTINLFYNLFPINNETPMPIMHAPSLALNERGEVVLFGGTGDTENINFVTGFDKVYSLREKLTLSGSQIDKVEAIPNYVARLNKVLTNEHTSNQPGPEVTIQSPKGERITGSPIIHNSTAYFTTYTPTTELPVCGIPGYSRVYGIHFNDQCRTANCFNALLSQQTPHFYHHILAYINSTVTPLKCCEQSGICTGNSNTPPSDQTFSSNPQTCGDLHYTVPMLPDRSTAPPHQYFRYLSVGANTLAMGVTFAYQPGETQVTQIKPGVPGHTYEVTHEGTSFLAFQIAGRNPSADLNFRLHHLRAIQPNIHPQLLQGNYTTIGLSQQGSPIMVSSWGSTLD
jgi:outer membrane protein assembly factor BamB